MTPELNTLSKLAASVERRRNAGRALMGLALFCAVLIILPGRWAWWWQAMTSASIVAVITTLLFTLRPVKRTTAQDYAKHLDARFAELEDSTSLLLDTPQDSVLLKLQREKTRDVFAQLEQGGQLTRSLPPVPWKRVGLSWVVLLTLALLSTGVRTEPPDAFEVTAGPPNIVDARVRLSPPAYTAIAPTTADNLNFATFEGSKVDWEVALDGEFGQVQFHFHDGEVLTLSPAGGRNWQSETWSARSAVYRVVADGVDVRNAVFRINAEPDQAPQIRVTQPEDVVRIVPAGAIDALTLNLEFNVEDDYGLSDTRARFTLARGSGEQVRFREAAIEVNPRWQDDRRSATVTHTLDLLELGMEVGDEAYIFAEAVDNRMPSPNVSTSQTYIVRWPAPDDRSVVAQATLAVPVVPEFFRSQRQIIIDTEKLMQQRPDLEEDEFRNRAQSLAIDQKLLRLRYGQYLGEEEDSGIGISMQAALMAHGDEAHEDHDEPDKPDEHDEHDDHDDIEQSEHHDEQGEDVHDGDHALDIDAHDHAAHSEGFSDPEATDTGDAQAVIALNAHMHDRAEQATLFEPETRELLRSALAHMWDAELQLRLSNPDAALPFEYAALKFIKQVQQSDRVYLRRTGFRPTPIDEERRLSGELDEVDSRQLDNDPESASQTRRLRVLLSALTHDRTPDASELGSLTDVIRTRALNDPTWLTALSAMERLQRDASCLDCVNELTQELWRQLDDALPPPSATPIQSHPLQRAYEQRVRKHDAL